MIYVFYTFHKFQFYFSHRLNPPQRSPIIISRKMFILANRCIHNRRTVRRQTREIPKILDDPPFCEKKRSKRRLHLERIE